MEKTLAALKASALGALTLVLLGGFVLELQISGSAVRLENMAAIAIQGIDTDVAKTGEMLTLVDKSLAAQPPDKLIRDARLTLDNINRAAIDERGYFEQTAPLLTTQVLGTVSSLGAAAEDLRPLILTAQAQIAGLGRIEDDSAKLIQDADATIADPAITGSLAHMEVASEQMAIASANSAAASASIQHMAADGEAEVHSLTHPKPLVSVANWTLRVVHAIGGFF